MIAAFLGAGLQAIPNSHVSASGLWLQCLVVFQVEPEVRWYVVVKGSWPLWVSMGTGKLLFPSLLIQQGYLALCSAVSQHF